MRLTGIVLAIIGVVGIIFGVIWVIAIFPRYEKIPSDFSRTDELEGSYTLVDPIVQQVLRSPAIQELRNSPSTLALLAEPEVQQFLAGPGLLALLSDPTLLQNLVKNLGILQQASSPATQQLLASPTVQAILANPAAAAQSTDPAIKQVLASPVIQQLLANPTALQLLLNPAAQGILANPVVPRLLADPGVQKLLADPASLKLVVDPRTMRLLADPTDFPVIKVPVLIHRERAATGTEGDKIFINEQVTTTIAGTGNELAGFPKSNVNLVVERSDKVYLEGTDLGRTGGLAFPFGVEKDVVYPAWVSAARQPLDAKYVSTERVEGLEVYIFEIDVEDLAMPAQVGDYGPLVVDSNVTLRVEPRSGRVVDIEDHATTVSLLTAADRKSTLFVSDIEYTKETVDIQIDEAKADRKDLVFYGTSLPRLTIGLGILMIILGAFAFLLSRRTRAPA
jgi:hypothetical protein